MFFILFHPEANFFEKFFNHILYVKLFLSTRYIFYIKLLLNASNLVLSFSNGIILPRLTEFFLKIIFVILKRTLKLILFLKKCLL